jgi:hypothetical protein
VCVFFINNNNNNNIYLTAIGLSPGGSGYLHVYKYKKLIINKFTFKAGGLHETHVVATWNLGNHLSIRLYIQGNQEKPVSRWPVAGPYCHIAG